MFAFRCETAKDRSPTCGGENVLVDGKDIVELVKGLAWPVVVLVALASLKAPLSDLIRTIARRATKFSAFKVELELTKLTQAQGSLGATVESLRQAIVPASGTQQLAAGIAQSGAADYVLVGLGSESNPAWLTSRLFLLASLLERNRVVRCIVFTGERESFIGAASPRDVRLGIGARFPEYEKAVLSAYGAAAGLGLHEFRPGNMSPLFVSTVVNTFIGAGSDIITFGAPPTPSGTWLYFDRSGSYELAEWITGPALTAMLGGRLSAGSVRAAPGDLSEEVTRAIVREPGAFVGLVNGAGAFEGLCDRAVIMDKIARSAAEQTAPA